MGNFERCIDILTEGDRNRVWSLVVTVFGDLAQAEGASLSMQSLARITEPLGVKPEALRVAMHRLKKDGWITSQRQGRNSLFRLTKEGRTQSIEAAPLIYRNAPPDYPVWSLYLASAQSQKSIAEIEQLAQIKNSVSLSQLEVLATGDESFPHLLQSKLSTDQLPDWLGRSIFSAATIGKYQTLTTKLLRLAECWPDSPDAFERATLRTLLVHSWRRVILSHADVPDEFVPIDCPLPQCRSLIAKHLEALPRPSLAELDLG